MFPLRSRIVSERNTMLSGINRIVSLTSVYSTLIGVMSVVPSATSVPVRFMALRGPCSLTLPLAFALMSSIKLPQKLFKNSMFVSSAVMPRSMRLFAGDTYPLITVRAPFTSSACASMSICLPSLFHLTLASSRPSLPCSKVKLSIMRLAYASGS